MNNIQINGQRRWGPPESWSGPPPGHGTEVFVKNLPEQVFELDLYASFSAAGTVYEVRLPVNWDGLNRGYAFVRFTTVREADEAIKIFDGYEIRRNRKIKVARSVDNTRLFLSAVPVDKNADDLKRELTNYVENIKKVYVYPAEENPSLFRGYAFVEFETHRDAAIAKRVLTPDVCYGLFDKKCVAAWANPLPYLDRSLLKSLNVLFMRNIPKGIKSFHLKKAIENLTGGEEIGRVKKMNNFAFLTFKDHKSAERALQQLQSVPFLISDHETQVEWAIPREIVASSHLAADNERGALGISIKRSEASKPDGRGRSAFRKELRFADRFQDSATSSLFDPDGFGFSKSPDFALSTHHDVTGRVQNSRSARMFENESAVSALRQSRHREVVDEMEGLRPKTIFSPSSKASPAAEIDYRQILPTNPDIWSTNDAFQNTAITESTFPGFSGRSFENISYSSLAGSVVDAENAEGRNLWSVNHGEESECGSEDNFFGGIHSDTSYSPLSPSPSVESPARSPFSMDEHDMFPPGTYEELLFKRKTNANVAYSRSNYSGMENFQPDQCKHVAKLSISHATPELRYTFIKRK